MSARSPMRCRRRSRSPPDMVSANRIPGVAQHQREQQRRHLVAELAQHVAGGAGDHHNPDDGWQWQGPVLSDRPQVDARDGSGRELPSPWLSRPRPGAGAGIGEDRIMEVAVRVCGRCATNERVQRGERPCSLWPNRGESLYSPNRYLRIFSRMFGSGSVPR
jgi:hypothetical protein